MTKTYNTTLTELERYTLPTPSAQQLMLQQKEFYAFVHFGINTFTDKEWGSGKEDIALFNPKKLDSDQWVQAVKAAGARGIILTAKHHDGFCLWQTKTTKYSIKNTPYKAGKGDIVQELASSCKKLGLAMGVYLSPWDRNSVYYGTEKYNDFYIEQLTELLTNYGELFCVWLDGACGSHMDGKPRQVYDFDRIYATIRQLQPNCAISNCGPDARWIGNEAALVRKSEFSVVPAFRLDTQTIEQASQTQTNKAPSKIEVTAEDLGSRAILAKYKRLAWYPAEVDVSIRPVWFYHSKEDNKVKSARQLFKIYCNSVGGNAMLLLNIPPNKDGLFADKDVIELTELGNIIHKAFSTPITATYKAPSARQGYEIEKLTKEGTYSPREIAEQYSIEIELEKEDLVSCLILCEDITYSQRVEQFEIYAKKGKKYRRVYKGTVIGAKKIAFFTPVCTSRLKVEILACRLQPYIKSIKVYPYNGIRVKKDKLTEARKMLARIGYKIYLLNNAIGNAIRTKRKKSN